MGVTLEMDVEHGWLIASLNVGPDSARWRASYLSDAVYDLLASTAATLNGHPTQTVFADGSGCTTLDLTPAEDGIVVLSLSQHDEWPLRGAGSGSPQAEFRVRARTFAGAVASAVQSLEAVQNDLDYQGRWHHPFPSERLALLRATLRDTVKVG
jgi:hypothetical protein